MTDTAHSPMSISTTARVTRDIPVRYTERPEVNRDFLTLSVPNGWDDVRHLCKRVLDYQGRRFTFTGWNSDRLECFFAAPHGGSQPVAKII